MNYDEEILKYLEQQENHLSELAKTIWEKPELPLHETYVSQLQAEELEKAGFSIQKNIGNMSTAFVATWGSGSPTIGFLGEYDALPGLSQKVSNTREPVSENGPGHGCGHNLLGIGSLGAALALKDVLESKGISGTVKYYGCPAEETLVGKVFMARDGVFDDLDVALTWHPYYLNEVWNHSTMTMNSFKINFHGVSTHESGFPEAGKSALDAVLLTEQGVNLLHRHITHDAYSHRVITDGGVIPDCVPDYSQMWYFLRAPHRDQLDVIYSRVLEIVQGAALMTQTSYDIDFLTGTYDYIPNLTVGEVLSEKFKKVGPPAFTEVERDFARELQKSLEPGAIESYLEYLNADSLSVDVGNLLCEEIIPRSKGRVLAGSTEVGDVSHITPTGQVSTCCMPLGCGVHTWQAVASFGSTIGFKGMMLASKVLALGALDLVLKPELLVKAKEEFQKSTKGKKYVSPLPGDVILPK